MKTLILEVDPMYKKRHIDICNRLNLSYELGPVGKEDMIEKLSSARYELIFSAYQFENQSEDSFTAVDLIRGAKLNPRAKVIIVTNFYTEDVYKKFEGAFPVFLMSKEAKFFEFEQAIRTLRNTSTEEKGNKWVKDRIYVKVGDNYKIISLEEIEMIEVDGKYLNVFVSDRKYNFRASIKEIMKKLPPNFLRVHGSYVVNINKVLSITPTDSTIKLENNTAPFSRNYKKEILDRFYFI